VLLAVLAVGSGCVSTAEFRKLEGEVARLKRDGPGASPPDARLADLGQEVEDLRKEMASLRGELEEVRYAAEQGQPAGPPAGAPPSVSRGLTGAGGQGGPGDPGAGQSPWGATPPAPPPSAAEASLTKEIKGYEAAFSLYRSEDFAGAIRGFRTFLADHPTSGYADNAQFWLGECQFKLGDYEQAVLAFDDVVKNYPEGNKVPDALYRQGVALLEIGNSKDQQSTYQPAARQIFERIVNDYPNSERVPEARRQLEKLGQ
jgi:tol-pal system protein YbgF